MLLESSQFYYGSQDPFPPVSYPPSPTNSFYSPAPSPFSPGQQADTFFQFPPTYPECKEELGWSHYPASHSPHSPLLSQASQPALPSDCLTTDSLRYAQTSVMPDPTSSLPFSAEQSAFGHYPGHALHGQYSNNLAVQQWAGGELGSEAGSLACSPARREAGEGMKEEAVQDVETDEESGGAVAGVTRCGWYNCGEECGDLEQLVNHITSHHIQTRRGSEEFPCLWEGCHRRYKPFNAKYKLVTHLRVHTGERPFQCKQYNCHRSFARLENLKIHNRSHTGEKPFLCKFHAQCNKAFSNSSDRAKHEQTHKDPKPYRCEVAGCCKKYTDPSSLRKHVKNHTREEQEQVRVARDAGRVRARQESAERSGWGECGELPAGQGNLGLMSGGGVMVSCGGGLGEVDSWARREEHRYPLYHTPLYLEV